MTKTANSESDADLVRRLADVLRLAGPEREEADRELRAATPDALRRYVADLQKVAGVGLADWNSSDWLFTEGSSPLQSVVRLGCGKFQKDGKDIVFPVAINSLGKSLVIRHDRNQREIAIRLANAVVVRSLATALGGEVEVSFFDPIGGGESSGQLNAEDAPSLRKSFRMVIGASALLIRQLTMLVDESEQMRSQKNHVIVLYDFPVGVTAEARAIWHAIGKRDGNRVTRIVVMSADAETPSSDDVNVVDLSSGELRIEGVRARDIDFVPDAAPSGAAFTALQERIALMWSRALDGNSHLVLPTLPASPQLESVPSRSANDTSGKTKISKESYFSPNLLTRLGLTKLNDQKTAGRISQDILDRAYANRLAKWLESYSDDAQGFAAAEAALREAREKLSHEVLRSNLGVSAGGPKQEPVAAPKPESKRTLFGASKTTERWPAFVAGGVLIGIVAILNSQDGRATQIPQELNTAITPSIDTAIGRNVAPVDAGRSDSLVDSATVTPDSTTEINIADSAYQATLLDASYFDYQVTREAAPLMAIEPVYPEAYKASGTEAVVNVQFVVDTTGRVDPRSLKALNEPNESFFASVQEALRTAQYSAAELNGRKVRQIVEQSFKFSP